MFTIRASNFVRQVASACRQAQVTSLKPAVLPTSVLGKRNHWAGPLCSDNNHNVGIVALDTYFPQKYVSQTQLEQFDKVSAGKYTAGLGQTQMSFVGDNEDIVSMSMTVVHSIMEKYGIDFKDIGRLEVGTETIIDKSKSVKSVLMQLFAESGNYNVDGLDTFNACYGGTHALMNAVNWVYSPDWDGRYALVVTGDIAVYSEGPARPSGGAGAVAMLVGRDAPIVLDLGLRTFHMEHAYDFYKPNMSSEYPLVDGKLSIDCYFRALDRCYAGYAEKWEKKFGQPFSIRDSFDHMIFHAPYNKLVRKAYGRTALLDHKIGHAAAPLENVDPEVASDFEQLALEDTYTHRGVEKALLGMTEDSYANKVVPSTYAGTKVGNTYTASVYAGIASLVSQCSDTLLNKRIGIFSYGSGLAASMFSFKVEKDVGEMARTLNLEGQLNDRTEATPSEFTSALLSREHLYDAITQNNDAACVTKPAWNDDGLRSGTYYLSGIDGNKRRTYARA